MAKVLFAVFVSFLLFMCLCIEDTPPSDGNLTSTTENVNETTTVSETISTGTEETTSTIEESTSTTFEWTIDTTLPETTTSTFTTTTVFTKKDNGLGCQYDSDCVSDNCIDDVCCNKGQCGFDVKCYNSGEKRRDGKVCSGEVWKQGFGGRCVNASECFTGYCIDGFCCNKGQCAFGMGAACYTPGQLRYDLIMTCAGNSIWKKSIGQRCETDDSCINGLCNKGYCCASTLCPFKGACYKVGEITSDGVFICASGYLMKKREGQSCGNSTDCSIGYCTNGYCCMPGQCQYSNRCYDSGDETEKGVCQSGVWRKE